MKPAQVAVEVLRRHSPEGPEELIPLLVPIVHGLLANGKRFTTNRFGAIKVFRPKKSIVIGSDPKLSDATKVARAAKKMTKAAEQILEVSGKKAVRR